MVAERARHAIIAIKNDSAGFSPPESMVEFAARRLSEEIAGTVLEPLFDGATLVPAPGSAPLMKNSRQQLRPTKRICEELQRRAIGRGVIPLLIRERAVPKSAYVGPGEPRPGPMTHMKSLGVASELVEQPKKLVIVDDVLTRGATLLGCAAALRRAYPAVEILGFALARTRSNCGELKTPIHPELHTAVWNGPDDANIVSYRGGQLRAL